jgi:hypothetical protein
MVRPIDDLELDSVIVPIEDDNTMSVDDWLASLREEPPLTVNVTAAELVAEARQGV